MKNVCTYTEFEWFCILTFFVCVTNLYFPPWAPPVKGRTSSLRPTLQLKSWRRWCSQWTKPRTLMPVFFRNHSAGLFLGLCPPWSSWERTTTRAHKASAAQPMRREEAPAPQQCPQHTAPPSAPDFIHRTALMFGLIIRNDPICNMSHAPPSLTLG